MLTPKKHLLTILLASLAFSSNASASLYGFSEVNPYTNQEKILKIDVPPYKVPNYRNALRQNIEMFSDYALNNKPNFQIVIHEGYKLLREGLWEQHLSGYNDSRAHPTKAKDPSFLHKPYSGDPNYFLENEEENNFLSNIKGIILNRPFSRHKKLPSRLRKSKLRIFALDLCQTTTECTNFIREAYRDNILLQTSSSPQKLLSNVNEQSIINENAKNIFSIQDAQNYLLIADEKEYADKYAFIDALKETNYDIIIIPAIFKHKQTYNQEDINSLKFKKNGTQRLVFAIMNTTEANPNEYYWRKRWFQTPPSWMKRKSFSNKDNVIVEYWHDDWRKIISSYFKSIVDVDFDGVLLTGLENHEYFEEQLPLE